MRIVISAARLYNGKVTSWTFDTHQSAARFWRDLTLTGNFPDMGSQAKDALYEDGKQTKKWVRDESKLPRPVSNEMKRRVLAALT